jgi:hypothetical protein
MAKEAPTLSKEERRALKAAKKEAKSSSKPEGVTKPEKKDKKDKKDKTVLAERALKEIQNAPTTKEDEEEDEDELPERTNGETESKKVNGIRPIGALVPFANPLADEKVAKKVFKGVKKGLFSLFRISLHLLQSYLQPLFTGKHHEINLTLPNPQQPAPARSNAASKKSSKPSANPHL